ncbi:MAG: ion channel [Acidobacteriota bacterium]
MSKPRPLTRRIGQHLIEYEDLSLTVFLIVLCLLSFGLLPLLEMTDLTSKLISAAYTLLFVAGAFIGGLTGGWRAFAFSLASVSILSAWLGDGSGAGFWETASLVSATIFMVFVCFQLTREVFRPGEVNEHRIRGAVAIYLLIGFIFALLFVLFEQLASGSFRGLGPDGFGDDMHIAVYFSFVTLTTLGYGDITPVSELAQTLVLVEAIIGQLFLVILIGRLVSLSAAGTETPNEL